MQIPKSILAAVEKYLAGTATAEEKEKVNEWYRAFSDEEVEIDSSENDTELLVSERIKTRLLQTIQKDNPAIAVRTKRRWLMPAAAAVILIFLSVGTYFIFFNDTGKKDAVIVKQTGDKLLNDIAPGSDKAVLTLADGAIIVLDSASNGVITSQGNIRVQKLENGQVAYLINGKKVDQNDLLLFNTVTTPRGGQYQLTLSDGTKVWLNAASSIRFPVVFTGTERNVLITGEAYFEVTKNTAMPFKVKAASSEIEVLGTHFNVNAYDDEATIKTTLLEGLVKISANNQSPKFLQPGQQSGVTKDGKINVIANADTEEAIAWINGRFQYKSADIKTILRQISRWYDVDVEYNGNVNIHFTGQLPRNQNVSGIFEKLELTGEVKFKIDGKKIIVSPN